MRGVIALALAGLAVPGALQAAVYFNSGGTVNFAGSSNYMEVTNATTVNLSGSLSPGGSNGLAAWATDNSRVNVVGGSIYAAADNAIKIQTATFSMSSGYIASNGWTGLELGNGSVVGRGTGTISGGTVTGRTAVLIWTGGGLTMTGGSVTGSGANNRGIYAQCNGANPSPVNISGGTVSGSNYAIEMNCSPLSLSGGTISGRILLDNSVMTVSGTNLAYAGDLLTGTLADGTPINTTVLRAGNSQVVLNDTTPPPPPVPVPSPAGLLGAAVIARACHRRR